ncbi:uncharacterized protein LOC114852940 [Betta splendens]|uniref:Uncharacterized protein LOC114852940 n=1 Tax=Betta splendens TaxID=158456 RepID=A0A6P7M5R8_BETSP|nr:uncharacterized protein LOC114852940 [Betta splendens]
MERQKTLTVKHMERMSKKLNLHTLIPKPSNTSTFRTPPTSSYHILPSPPFSKPLIHTLPNIKEEEEEEIKEKTMIKQMERMSRKQSFLPTIIPKPTSIASFPTPPTSFYPILPTPPFSKPLIHTLPNIKEEEIRKKTMIKQMEKMSRKQSFLPTIIPKPTSIASFPTPPTSSYPILPTPPFSKPIIHTVPNIKKKKEEMKKKAIMTQVEKVSRKQSFFPSITSKPTPNPTFSLPSTSPLSLGSTPPVSKPLVYSLPTPPSHTLSRKNRRFHHHLHPQPPLPPH